MSTSRTAAPGPAPELRFHRSLRPVAMLRELWARRELVAVLTERDLRARYKQTKVGFGWALLTPFLLMVVFTLVFDRVADVPTNGIPYPVFSYIGLLPWVFFSGSLSKGAISITSNLSLLNKVYCPREVFPLSTVAVSAVDTAIATSILAILFVVYGVVPTPEAVWVPVLVAVLVAFTCGVTLLLSACVVYLRDIRQVLPMLLQFGLFATPIGYSLEEIPRAWWPAYAAANPLGPVIDGLRRCVLLGEPPRLGLLAIAAVSSALWLSVAYLLFKRMETGFADVA